MLRYFSNLLSTIPALCRGDRALIDSWMEQSPTFVLSRTLPLIILGCGSYGLSMGLWQGWEMASYAGLKFPLVVIATLAVNAMINAMLAMVLGSGISMRQSMQFLFTAFAICALILGALSPITIGMAIQGPAAESPDAKFFHSVTLLTHVFMISYAGIVSHSMLLGALRKYATTRKAGMQTFIAWLLGNLFVGAQIGWISRPFFGSPGSPIQFLRDDKFASSFYESIFRSLQNIF
ncbi:MAG: hypothetical protein ACI9SQ_000931 [Rubritalea sp.]|jgi:hypothetical protein